MVSPPPRPIAVTVSPSPLPRVMVSSPFVRAPGVYHVPGAVAERDGVAPADADGHRVLGAIAEGDSVVNVSTGGHRIPGAVAKGDCIVAAAEAGKADDVYRVTG